MRSILLSCTAIALTFASTAQAAEQGKNGFYAGIVAGYSKSDLDTEGFLGGPQLHEQNDMDAGDFGIVGGYHHDFTSKYFVELEAEAVVSFGETKNIFNAPYKLEKDGAFSLAVKPGYHINDKWSAFLTLGAQWVEYTATYAPTGYEESDMAAGFLHGIGVNYKLDKDVSITAEYNRVQPLDVKYTPIAGVGETRFDPELDIVKVALKYHF